MKNALLNNLDIELLKINKLEGLFPSLNSSFKGTWLENWEKNELLLNTLKKINNQNPGLNITVLKGLVTIRRYYQNLGERYIGDMDLLISKDEYQALSSLLIKLGFCEIPENKWVANNFKTMFLVFICN